MMEVGVAFLIAIQFKLIPGISRKCKGTLLYIARWKTYLSFFFRNKVESIVNREELYVHSTYLRRSNRML